MKMMMMMMMMMKTNNKKSTAVMSSERKVTVEKGSDSIQPASEHPNDEEEPRTASSTVPFELTRMC